MNREELTKVIEYLRGAEEAAKGMAEPFKGFYYPAKCGVLLARCEGAADRLERVLEADEPEDQEPSAFCRECGSDSRF